MHCVLWLSQAIISVVLAFAHVGLVRSVQGGVHSQDGQTVGRSKMERHEQYVWMVGGETHVVAQEDFT